MKIVIAAGGTAGHVNPALALADALEGDEVTFVGTPSGLEADLVPAAGFPFQTVSVQGFDRGRPLHLPVVAVRAVGAVGRARRLLGRARPQVVVGMGGYVSLPVCVAARSQGIPVVIHEQNIVFGLANRVCKHVAEKVAVSFHETIAEAGDRGVVTGNPVGRGIVELDRDAARRSGLARFDLDPARKTVIVFGGSLGARRLNDGAARVAELWRDRDDVQILHIAGRSATSRGESGIADATATYRVVDYVPDMGEAYAVADLAVCRGGASTVAELSVVGLPAIIVPYPFHRDRQQERHGRVLEHAGAAVVVLDAEASAERLASEAAALLNDDVLDRMSAAARSFGRPHAAASLAEVVRSVA